MNSCSWEQIVTGDTLLYTMDQPLLDSLMKHFEKAKPAMAWNNIRDLRKHFERIFGGLM
jgi:hypothetical protein